MTARGVRNNNPGNIMKSTDEWQGLVGYDDDGYAIFDSPESGIRAKGRVLMTYGRKGYNTLPKMFERYAPKGHGNNDPAAYAAFVSKATGYGLNDVLDLQNPTVLMNLSRAINRMENGEEAANKFTDEQYLAGIESAISGKGITPKSKPIPSDGDVFAGIGVKQTVGTDLPTSTGFSVEGVKQAPPELPFARKSYEYHGDSIEDRESRSTWFGFGSVAEAETSKSLLGVAYRAAKEDDSWSVFEGMITPTSINRHEFTKEELDYIRKHVKDPSYVNAVTGGDGETLEARIKLANENYEMDSRNSKAGLAAQLTGGVIGAAVDPLSYVPFVGATGQGIKLTTKAARIGVQAAALNVASEHYLQGINGGQAHYEMAAVGGFMFGSGMSALADSIGMLFRKQANPNGRLSDQNLDMPNEFAGATRRLEQREHARNTGDTDASRMPPSEARVFHGEKPVPYADHPSEKGAVILEDGSVISADNPINPKTIETMREIDPETPRAAKGVSLGGFTEIGYKILRSEDAEIRGIGSDLVRSSTGMQDGSSGKFGATADDILDNIRSLDHRTYNQYADQMNAAMKDVEWTVGDVKFTKQQIKQEIDRRVATAIEKPELRETLTDAEKKLADTLKAHFDRKREYMENPAMFGDSRAKGFFPDSRNVGTYIPRVYSLAAKNAMIQKLGSREKLYEAVSMSFEASYHGNKNVKARVDEMLKEKHNVAEVTPQMVKEYADSQAYGITMTDKFNRSSVIEDNIDGMVGIENNSFLEARNLFDTDAKVFIEGQPFSVDDLRDFDMKHIMPAYDRRVNGDIAIMGSTGKTTGELKDSIMALKAKAEGNGKMLAEVDALQDVVKMLTGRSRRNMDTTGETVLRTMTDLSFFAKNAYMAAQNLTEIAGMLSKGNVRAMLHGIPIIRDLAFRNKPVSGQELKDIHGMLFGKELDDLIRPDRADIVQRLRENSDIGSVGAQILGTAKFSTQELAARSPFTKLLMNSSNYLVDTARQGMMGNVIESALTGKKSKWATDGFLNGASITKEQYKGIQNLIRENFTRGEDGKYTLTNKKAFMDDPRHMDLWRLADKVANETILRPTKLSTQDAKAYGAGIKMAMQFKSFTIKSMNNKFVRSFHEATKNGRAIDTAMTWALSLGIATGYFAMQAHVKSLGLPEQERAEYLKKALDPTMLGYAALSRSSHIGAPLSLVNFIAAPLGFDQAKMVRSTIIPKAKEEKDSKAISGFASGSSQAKDFYAGVVEQIPALGWASNVAASGYNAVGYLGSKSKVEEMDFMTGLMNTTRELVPNDPITQQILMHLYNEQGVYIEKPKGR